MKIRVFAPILFICVLVFVTVNSFALSSITADFEKRTEKINLDSEDWYRIENEFNTLKTDFDKYELYIALTVNYQDLKDVSEAFAECFGAIKAEDANELSISKSRLKDTLSHIRRLVSFNISEII